MEPSVKALDAVRQLEETISPEDLRSSVLILGGGDFDINYHNLQVNQGQREKEICAILHNLAPNKFNLLRELVMEIDRAKGILLDNYIPLHNG